MDKRNLCGLSLGLVTLACVTSSHADILHLTDGQKLVGIIQKQKTDANGVTIRGVSGEIRIPRAKVARIEEEPAAVSYLGLGNAYLDAGNYDKAIESYEMGLTFDSQNMDLQQKLQQAKGGVNTQQTAAQAALDDRARRAVDQAMQLARSGNFDSAYSTLLSIEPSEFSPVYGEYRKAQAELHVMWGQSLLDKQNTPGASEKLNEALRLDPSNAQAKQLLIKTYESDPTKLEESAAFYAQATSPEEQLKGADAYFKLQRYEEAAAIYMKYMSDPSLNSRFNITARLQTILDTLHEQYASRGDYRKAMEYFALYHQVKPDADVTPYSKYLYMVKRGETDMNNMDSRLELALLAEQLGLIPVATEEYRNILSIDPENSGALTALRKYAESDLADAREFASTGEYALAAQMAQDVKVKYRMYPDLMPLANQIEAQARVEAQKVQASKTVEARALAERGDNYYNQAMQYMGAYASTDIDERKYVFSPRNEAAKFLGQAIYAWQAALKLDPSLGDITTYNLHFKIQDARNKYMAVANRRAPRIPRLGSSR